MGAVSASLGWLQRFMQRFTPYLNDLVIFLLILFIGFLVGKILGRLVRKLLAEIKLDAFLRRSISWKVSMERSLGSITAGIIYLVTIILAFNAVGLTTIVLELLLAVVMLAIALGFLLALRDIVPNAASGLTLKRKLREGMEIEMEGASGVVKEVTLLETIIETKSKEEIIIPNALFAKQRMKIKRSR